MKNPYRYSILLLTALLLLAGLADAQPLISLYTTLDKSPVGPSDQILYNRVTTIYVVVENAEMMIGGASFRLGESYGFLRVGESFPEGVAIGNLFSGVELGLTTPVPQFGTPAVIASFLIFTERLAISNYWVEPHPDESSILVSDSLGNLHASDGNTLELRSYIQPEIGIFFDGAGTQLEGSFNGGEGETVTAYLMLRDLEHPINSSYLSLNLPPGIDLVSVALPDGANLNGDLAGGAILSFSPPLAGAPGAASLMATLTLSTGTETSDGMMLSVGGYPEYGLLPFVIVAPVGAYPTTVLTSTMSVPVPNEDLSWGSMKALFR